MFKFKLKNLALLVAVLLCGCSGVTFSDWHFPYMTEVSQGTYITKQQYSQIKPGISKEQVVFILGHPLSQYLFDKNRWDFNYQNHKNNDLKKTYQVIIYFDGDGNVTKVDKVGDELFDS